MADSLRKESAQMTKSCEYLLGMQRLRCPR